MKDANKYNVKTRIVNAIQWNGNNIDEILDFGANICGLWGGDFKVDKEKREVIILSANPIGYYHAKMMDWIVSDEFGIVYPLPNEVFKEFYEKA